MLKILIVANLILGCFSVAGAWEPGAEIAMEYRVKLSTGMAAALKDYDPEFEIWDANDFAPFLRGVYEYKSSQPSRSFLARQTPSAVIGDFNGDKAPDMALLGRNKTHGKRIALLSGGGKYSVIAFEEQYPLTDPMMPRRKFGGGNLEEYLELVEPRKIKAEPAYDRPELDLKTDAFKFGVFEKASGLYLYKNGKFVNYTMSD